MLWDTCSRLADVVVETLGHTVMGAVWKALYCSRFSCMSSFPSPLRFLSPAHFPKHNVFKAFLWHSGLVLHSLPFPPLSTTGRGRGLARGHLGDGRARGFPQAPPPPRDGGAVVPWSPARAEPWRRRWRRWAGPRGWRRAPGGSSGAAGAGGGWGGLGGR